MQAIWARFDALDATTMLEPYVAAATEYVGYMTGLPDAFGLQEVDGFAGHRPVAAYQLARLWELACHSWDIYVAADAQARLAADAVAVLAPRLDLLNLPLDKARAADLPLIGFRLVESGAEYTLDPRADRARLSPGLADPPVLLEGPDEELVRLVSGRQFIPGAQPALSVARGTTDELNAVRRAFRP